MNMIGYALTKEGVKSIRNKRSSMKRVTKVEEAEEATKDRDV